MIKLEATIDDKQFLAAAERDAKALRGVGAAAKDAGKNIDRDFRDNSIGSLEEVGKRMGRLRALINNVALAGVGMKVIGNVGQFTSEMMEKAADETRGLNKELYDSAKAVDTWAKAIRFDIGGVFKNVIFKDVEFQAAKLEKKHAEIMARAKAIDVRNLFMGEKAGGKTKDDEEAQKRITGIVLQREAALASIEAKDLSRFQGQFKRHSDIINELSQDIEANADKMTAYESMVTAARLGTALAGEEQRKSFDTAMEIKNVHDAMNEELDLQVRNYQQITVELEQVGDRLKNNKVEAAELDKTQQRFQKLLARQIEMKREELAIEEQLRRANLERFQAEQKDRDDARKSREDRIVGNIRGALGGDGAQTKFRRRGGFGSMIPGMMMQGPGIFGGPGIMGGPSPLWPGVEGGGGDFGDAVAGAGQRGIGAAVRARQNAIMPNMQGIADKFAQERKQRQTDFEAIKAAIADVLGREGNRDDLMAQAGRIGQAARKAGIAGLGKNGELIPNFRDINQREGGAMQAARDEARRKRAQVPRQVREEMARGEAPKDVAAAQEDELKKLVDEVVKGGGIGRDNAGVVMALAKALAQLQKDHEQTRKDGQDTRKIIEALGQNKLQRAFNKG